MSWPASPNTLPAISMLCCHGIGSRPRHHAAKRLNLTASNLKLPCGLYRMLSIGLRGEDSIAELCRREGIIQNLYYRWSKEFLEPGKKRLAGDTAGAATSDEGKDLRREAGALKEAVAELLLENRLLKKSTIGAGEDGA